MLTSMYTKRDIHRDTQNPDLVSCNPSILLASIRIIHRQNLIQILPAAIQIQFLVVKRQLSMPYMDCQSTAKKSC
jgi:hypothetical protein